MDDQIAFVDAVVTLPSGEQRMIIEMHTDDGENGSVFVVGESFALDAFQRCYIKIYTLETMFGIPHIRELE